MHSLFDLDDNDSQREKALQALLDHALINEATDDDKTLVMATRSIAPIQPSHDQFSDESVTEFESEEPERDDHIRQHGPELSPHQ